MFALTCGEFGGNAASKLRTTVVATVPNVPTVKVAEVEPAGIVTSKPGDIPFCPLKLNIVLEEWM